MLAADVAAVALIACSVLAAGSIVWFTFKTGISPMPSSVKAGRTMLAASADAPDGPIVDLGSGWGTLAIVFARKHPARQVIGYEVSWFPWLVSSLLQRLLRLHNLSFRREDFRRAELSNAAVLLCYLFPRGMQDLARKLARDRCGPVTVISNTFALPSFAPDEVIQLDDVYRTRIYVYRRRPRA
ncbi:class I SAM-dependent methyltransferase [Piscinibacter sp.]|uniref:class I SAM-dependent methyltransferase n=1 Tax=Piscinibacter sp. TaxID=1903157 RepID=UPI002B89754F|nr:class I SAM-dependent methyltransferase [Albitalea sp.]HUG22344.1 class I SAM-dependent methyltransferase [Albitalea sp.]